MKNKKKLLFLISFFGLIVLGAIFFFPDSSPKDLTPIDSPEVPPRGFFMGVLPNAPDASQIENVYEEVSNYNEFVPVWPSGTGASGFWDYEEKLEGWWGKTFLKSYIREKDMFPIVHFSFIDKNQDSGRIILDTPDNFESVNLSDQDWRALYKESIIEVVRSVKPRYLSTGNEVNRWYEEYGVAEGDPNGFQHFVSLHEEIYEEVKDISPETKIFCVFSREIVDKNEKADLDVLKMFDPDTLDILVFTSYPFAVPGINRPSDIPDNYYLTASELLPDKPFGFSELAWPSSEFFGGSQGQVGFLEDVSGRLTIDQGVDLHLLGYLWLYDVSAGDDSGLVKRDGTEKLAYQTWKQISESK